MPFEFEVPETLSKKNLEDGTVFAPKFDAKGLIMAVTTEHGSKDLLMVAYMNKQALSLTLETGIVHYYSRSRQSLWKKGETSGEMQQLIEMRTDCDQDVLLLNVEQTGRGAACHTGQKSCFYRKVRVSEGKAELQKIEGNQIFDPTKVY